MNSASPNSTHLLAIALLFEGGLALAACGLGWLIGQSPTGTLDWQPAAVGWGALASLPLVALLLVMVHFPFGPLERLQRSLDEVVLPLFTACSWFDFAAISLLAGFGEEMMFRGLAQSALGRWLSPAVGLILASVLFGLAHPISTTYVVVAAIFGLYLGLVWLWSGNLLVAIMAHAVYDFIALVYLVGRHRRRAGLIEGIEP